MEKYKQVLILYNIKEREYLLSKMTADVLREGDIAEEIIIGQVYETIFHIYDYEPDMIISCLARDDYSTAMFTMVKLVHQCRWVSIPPEGFMSLEQENMRIYIGFNKQPVSLLDQVLFWGDGIAKAAGQLMLEQGKISSSRRMGVFGYLPYEKALIKKYAEETEQVRSVKEKAARYSSVVMALTGRMAVPLKQGEIETFYDPADKEQNENIRKRFIASEYYADKYIQLLEYIAENNKETLLVVKLHPADVRQMTSLSPENTRYHKLWTMDNVAVIDESVQISVYFDSVDYMIHYGSTAALEAYIYHIPTIGILNDHPDTQFDSFGGGNLYADKEFVLSEKEAISECIRRKPAFVRNEKTENVLNCYMNYREGEEYRPSRLLIDQLRNGLEKQELNIGENGVRTAINRPNVRKRRIIFRMKMWKATFSGNEEESDRIRQWLVRYKNACKKGNRG